MTKPDTLTAGSTKARGLWLEVLEGRRYPLHHGYYCTRQPDDDERSRGISGAAACAAEASFFQSTAPWSGSNHQHRFGTTNLMQNISRLLTQIIRESYVILILSALLLRLKNSPSLPEILDNVAAQFEACNAQLTKLPPLPMEDPVACVYNLVTTFSANVKDYVVGSPAGTDLVQANRDTYQAFKFAIRASAPPFAPYKNERDARHPT